MSQTCFFCASPIHGSSVRVWSEPFGGGPTTYHPAHPDCARMLEDDDSGDEDDMEEDDMEEDDSGDEDGE